MTEQPTQLNAKNLASLPEDVRIPTYNRKAVKAGIVHIGVGGFHRAHQAYLVNCLLQRGLAKDWGICGVSLLPNDRKIYDVLSEQDGLYTLMIPNTDGDFSAEVIGSIVELLYAPENPDAVLQKIADESTRLVTLTITEGGYNFTSDGNFNWDNDTILWDLQHPDQPKTVFGYLYAALKLRRVNGTAGLTIQSCDNMEHNGDVIRRMLYAFISKADPDMISWLDEYIAFPNSMVDRITPVTTDNLKVTLVEKFGIQDAWPVVCEPYYQWIIQDSYAAGRPEWEQAGVQLVPDVTPYEKMKIRLLNGGHTLIGLTGYLLGYQYIHESVTDPVIADLLKKYMDEEVTPTLDHVQGVDLPAYKNILIQRFRNPFIKDEVGRIISGSSAKFPKFILPVVLDRLSDGQSVEIAALIVACWYQYLKLNLPTPQNIQDEMAVTLLKSVAKAEEEQNPLLFLSNEEIFGHTRELHEFTENYVSHLAALHSIGIKDLINNILNKEIKHLFTK